MPRIRRFVLAGVPHHVTQRGNRREPVFFGDADRTSYLRWLRDYAARHGLDVLAYCLMPNHVHLVVVPATRDALQRALKPLHMRHAQHVNRAKECSGHVWQGRFFSSALDETYLWAAIRYVERNPVRARFCSRAEEYAWSSAAAHCGLRGDPVLCDKPSWLRQRAAIGDWSHWLSLGDEPASLKMLRAHADRGYPCGSQEFVDAWQTATGHTLKSRGRFAAAKGSVPSG